LLLDLTLAFFTAFLLVMIAMPSLIKVAKLKHLVDEPGDERKLHNRSVPTIGGIMIFAGTLFAYCLLFPSKETWMMGNNYDPLSALNEFKYLVASMFVLFFLGLKDDIIGVSPNKKLYVHALVGVILVYLADIRITSFWGLFEVNDLPYWFSLVLSLFTYIVIVNAINLIDGVDGLAGGIGVIASLTFAIWFYTTGDLPLALLAISLTGALIGFLVFNFQPAKIFMGDSGSLILGMVLYVLAMKLIEFPPSRLNGFFQHVSKPVLVIAMLSYPLMDTLRIFTVRIANRQSPFKADKNHIHHKLLNLGFSHRQVCMILYAYTIGIIVLTFLMPKDTPNISLAVVFVTTFLSANGLFWWGKKS
jgi:UDP-N-acetylmuramyl pentapeptide phosphotransferase/UDP-N-acetylglucosamine-1-phosphate transferase